MKRVGNLYQQIAEPENLRLAFHRACRGKQERGEVVRFRRCFDANLAELRRQLLQEDVPVGDYRFFEVFDPKRRQICAAAFRERVLHHAIMAVCEPVFERYAIFDTYACRPGKGQRMAVARAQQFARQFDWYLKLDIRRYFDSIDHKVLLGLLARRFKDRQLLHLFETILSSYCTSPGKGLPIGNLVSQHLANFYLGHLDHWLKDDMGVKGYLRYMDDFLIYSRSREELKDRLGRVRGFLAGKLHLELKQNIQLNRCRLGIPFLGLRVFPARVLLSRRSGTRFRDRLRQYEARHLRGEWSETELAAHLLPLVEFTRGAEAVGLRRQLIEDYGVVT
ncbi:hypothetical protein C2E25_16625 [Geothermobacter hydrogeniphilus]|uniref:Reverse transcriptase domain-containing protein n=1 Tax=Geothermobacter hydrogeniphilus TaxID=1969733 RepID=A0A2K2H5P7_9BACT|nr:reverse transcriptase/maturase family protein [Geothermobacter hydrogeniphilus]PNU18645.1 hypothetical protein C2E25_16625 [Geothermobacter hydrogeniphilus]